MGAGERETQEGCNTSTHTADSLCCTAETNTALKSNYSRYIYIYTYKASRGSDLELAQSHSWQILLVEASHRSSSYSNGGEIDSTILQDKWGDPVAKRVWNHLGSDLYSIYRHSTFIVYSI